MQSELISSPTKVYVMAENRLLRETLVRLFRKRSEISIVGDTCCSDSAIENIVDAKTDLLLLDCFNTKPMPDDWLTDLQESIPEVKIILFGMDEDPDVFLRAVRRGVAGYVLKSASATDLLDAVRTVAQGEAACPPKFCKVLFKTLADGTTEEKDERGISQFELTQRQRQLMSLVAMGLSNKEIAANLNLSEFTVKNHIYRVMKQVDAQSRHQAVSLIRDSD
jgi:two-component system, NarL family, response regulator DevR